MTLRSFIIGLVCVALLALLIPCTDILIRGSWFGLTGFPIGSLLALLAVVAIVGPPLRLAKRPFSPKELAVIASMCLVSAGVASFGLTTLLLQYLAGPTYFMTTERPDDNFLHLLPKWAMVGGETEPGETMPRAVEEFYEGQLFSGPIPWEAWSTPLSAWGIQILAVYLVFFCLVTLLRKPWMENERLVFPLAELPAAIVSERTAPTGLAGENVRFFRNRLMWGFFLVPVLVHTLNGLNHYYPSMPRINVNQISLDAVFFLEHPWNKLGPFWVKLPFSMLGFAYFLPLAVSRSMWVFYFFFMFQVLMGARAGYPMPPVQAYPTKAFVGQQMWGGILVSGVYLLWSARRHIGQVFRAALSRRRDPELQDELLSPRWAVFGLIGGFVVICGWGVVAGTGLIATAVVFGLYFLTHIVAVRLVCEGGMPYVQHPYRPLNLVLATVGSSGLGKSRVPMLAMYDHLWMLDNRSPLMPTLMLTQRIAEPARLSRRSLTPALWAAVLVAAALSIFAYLRIVYEYGGRQLHPWFTQYYAYSAYSMWAQDLTTIGQPANPTGLYTIAAGALSFVGVLKLYHAFPKWAFHPIGYLMGASWPMVNFWFPIMLAWIIKSSVMRIGGVKLYRRLAPGFLGFVLAEFLCAALWTIIGWLAHSEQAYQVFAI